MKTTPPPKYVTSFKKEIYETLVFSGMELEHEKNRARDLLLGFMGANASTLYAVESENPRNGDWTLECRVVTMSEAEYEKLIEKAILYGNKLGKAK